METNKIMVSNEDELTLLQKTILHILQHLLIIPKT